MRVKSRSTGLVAAVAAAVMAVMAAAPASAVPGPEPIPPVLTIQNRLLTKVVDVWVDGVRMIDNLPPGSNGAQLFVAGVPRSVVFTESDAANTSAPLFGGAKQVVIEESAPKTLVVHRSASGSGKASLFLDPVGPVEPEHGLVTLRHVAQAGAIDVWIDGVRYPIALTNGHQVTLAVPAAAPDVYPLVITPAGAGVGAALATLPSLGMDEGMSWTLAFSGWPSSYGIGGTSRAAEVRTFFTDIAGTSFQSEIQWLADEGISTGWSNGDGTASFRPYANVARDAMAAFLYRFKGSPGIAVPLESPFVDVPVSHPFYQEIYWLYQQGISTGWDVGGGMKEFRPHASITRDAMAAFLYRLVGVEPMPGDGVGDAPFIDVSPSLSEFNAEIEWLADAGISTGWDLGDGTKEFRPFAHITRDAMAAFLYRLHNLPS